MNASAPSAATARGAPPRCWRPRLANVTATRTFLTSGLASSTSSGLDERPVKLISVHREVGQLRQVPLRSGERLLDRAAQVVQLGRLVGQKDDQALEPAPGQLDAVGQV